MAKSQRPVVMDKLSSSERSSSKPNAKKTSKLTPNDDSRHVQLINLEP